MQPAHSVARRSGAVNGRTWPRLAIRRYLSVKSKSAPRADDHLSTTHRTRPGADGPRKAARSNLHPDSEPSATTSTLPSSRFVALPTRPSSLARDRVHHRKPTPCTLPCTQAVSRTTGSSATARRYCLRSAGPGWSRLRHGATQHQSVTVDTPGPARRAGDGPESII